MKLAEKILKNINEADKELGGYLDDVAAITVLSDSQGGIKLEFSLADGKSEGEGFLNENPDDNKAIISAAKKLGKDIDKAFTSYFSVVTKELK